MPTITQQPLVTSSKNKTPPQRKQRGGGLWFVLLFLVVFGLVFLSFFQREEPVEEEPAATATAPEAKWLTPWIEPQILEVDGDSRRGEKLEAVRNIVVHYVGNPGTTAKANRNWFANPESDTSSHFIVGLEGEVIQCIPLNEKSSATNERNSDTISVEVCHPDESGKFSEVTRKSLIRLLTWLCEKYDFDEESLIRHYDVTGKKCPLYYVENEEEWLLLKSDVKRALEGEILWEE